MVKPRSDHPWRKDALNTPVKSIPMPKGIGLSPERLAQLSAEIRGAGVQTRQQSAKAAARFGLQATDRGSK